MILRNRSLYICLLLGAIVTAAYWSGLYGSFFFDDEANILHVESLRLVDLSFLALREAWESGRSGPGGRPIAQLSFALNHYFSGFDFFVFKATNLTIHLLTGVLVFLIAQRMLVAPLFAGVAAALWLLHPIQLTSVLYVVQRMTSLSTLFLLAGFLIHITARERGGRPGVIGLLIAWLICWPLAFFSKEIGAIFPLFVLSWELIIRRNTVGRLDRAAWLLVLAVGLGSAVALSYLFLPAGQWLWAGYEFRSFTPIERLLTEGRVLWFYLGLIVFPRFEAFSLYHDDIGISTGLLAPWTTLPAGLGLLALVWLAWHVRQRAPLVSFGIAWFLVGHLLESTVLPLEIAHEHRNYLPSVGLFIAFTSALARLIGKPGWQKTLGVTLAGVVIGYLSLVTTLRAHLYGDEIRRTQIEAQHHMTSARTQYAAGHALVTRVAIDSVDSPSYFFAGKYYERASELDSTFKLSWLGLIHLNCMVGKPPEARWIEELAHRLRETPLGPGDRTVLFSIKEMSIAGTLCLAREDVEKLFGAASTNAKITPNVRAILHSGLADYLTLVAHDLSAAEDELNKSVTLAPYIHSNRLKQLQLAYLQGKYDEARKMLGSFGEATLTRSERDTLALLRDCLKSNESVSKCTGQ